MSHKLLPYRPGHGGYVSEFEQFLNGYIDSHPEVLEDRKRGWLIWWERKPDLREMKLVQADSVPRGTYYYD